MDGIYGKIWNFGDMNIALPAFNMEYLWKIIISVLVILLASLIRILIRKVTQKYVSSHARFELQATHINRVSSIFINLTSTIIIIVLWGVNPENLFIALSSVFAVIGVALFAQWSILSNITAGIILFFSSPFRIGNYIRIMDNDMTIEAKIEDVFTFHTHLRTREGELHVYPNNMLLQRAIAIIDDNGVVHHPTKQKI